MRDQGFQLVEAPNCRENNGHAAGSIAARVKALHHFFEDPSINGILSFWGGLQTHQILDHLDYRSIARNPKVLIGFSDTTALQNALFNQIGLVTFSGPAGITFGKPTVPQFTLDHFKNAVMSTVAPFEVGNPREFSENPWYLESEQKMVFQKASQPKIIFPGKAKGRILGGNLGTLLLLAGTPYWPKMKNKVLFVEEDEVESAGTIDRMFYQLRQMGVFKQIKGMVVGRFHSSVGFSKTDSLSMILKDALKGYQFPVMTDLAFGHTDPMITIPLGIQCAMDTETRKITYLESGVK